jgi:hypothetical protein
MVRAARDVDFAGESLAARLPALFTLADVEGAGYTPADLAELCPWAVEYLGLDGSPCWFPDDLGPLCAAGGAE